MLVQRHQNNANATVLMTADTRQSRSNMNSNVRTVAEIPVPAAGEVKSTNTVRTNIFATPAIK
jgi:hypothetical protein